MAGRQIIKSIRGIKTIDGAGVNGQTQGVFINVPI